MLAELRKSEMANLRLPHEAEEQQRVSIGRALMNDPDTD
jgi:ABC-type ATPase involved in cell division